jgi:hypothetical protein
MRGRSRRTVLSAPSNWLPVTSDSFKSLTWHASPQFRSRQKLAFSLKEPVIVNNEPFLARVITCVSDELFNNHPGV